MVANIEAADRRTGSLASNDPDHPGTAPTITVVTSRSADPARAWRPADVESVEVPVAAMPAVLSGLAAQLSEILGAAGCIAHVAASVPDLAMGGINLRFRWSEEVVAAILACGGEIRHAYWEGGFYALAEINRDGVEVSCVGPYFYGPLTVAESARRAGNVKTQIAAVGLQVAAHGADADCAPFLVDDACTVCGVVHTNPCWACGGCGYHAETCTESS